jgi:hypothetical protein
MEVKGIEKVGLEDQMKRVDNMLDLGNEYKRDGSEMFGFPWSCHSVI